mmetsp:Transcript_1689/g.3914  ORF Transcript_1689/g.3914 Transcript_1689/m.3914 type:complete len:227 (+) Transcript_1689:333-1013(+)
MPLPPQLRHTFGVAELEAASDSSSLSGWWLVPKDWNQIAVFAPQEAAPNMEVFALSPACFSLGLICSCSSLAFSSVCANPVWMSWSSCCMVSEARFTATSVTSVTRRSASDAPWEMFSSALCAILSVSFTNSEFASSSPIFFADCTTLPQPQDTQLFAAPRPFCILSIGNASCITFCMPPVSESAGLSEASPRGMDGADSLLADGGTSSSSLCAMENSCGCASSFS